MENTSSAHKMVAMSRAKSKIENKKQKQENRATKLHSSDLHTSVPASKLDVFNINPPTRSASFLSFKNSIGMTY